MKKTQATFKPKAGQVDFTHIRWAPVINCVVQYKNTILIVQRSPSLNLYPGYWNGISGFLDDNKSLKEKVIQELREELGVKKKSIVSITRGLIFDQEAKKYKKTWIVHPVLVCVTTDNIKLDWEARNYRWVKVSELKHYRLLPGFDRVLASFFPRINLGK